MTSTPPALPLSSARASRLLWRAESESTNTELVRESAAGAAAWPHFSALVTDNQVAGRARLDRSWQLPAGAGLAVSVLLRPQLPFAAYGWLSLLAGTAMTETVAAMLAASGLEPARAALKWPNDVLVEEKKICGVLAEITPEGAVVIGAGLNTALTAEQLPVPTATSLHILGADNAVDVVLSTYLERFRELYDAFEAAAGDARESGLLGRVEARCHTLSRRVRVEMPGGIFRHGLARGLDEAGHLLVVDDATGVIEAVAAGDITHLRTPDVSGAQS